MLIELARTTPTDIAPLWRQRIESAAAGEHRANVQRTIGEELAAYGQSTERQLPSETSALLDRLTTGSAPPAWVDTLVPSADRAALRDLLQSTVTHMRQALRSDPRQGAAGMRQGMRQAHEAYTVLRQASLARGLNPAILGVVDLHYRQIIADARNVAVIRDMTGPALVAATTSRGGPAATPQAVNVSSVAREHEALAMRYLEGIGQIPEPTPAAPSRGRQLVSRLAKRAALWTRQRIGVAPPRLVNESPKVQADRAGGPALPEVVRPSATFATPSTRAALQREMERRLIVRAALEDETVTIDTVAHRFVRRLPATDLAILSAVGERLDREGKAAGFVETSLTNLAEHRSPTTLTNALRGMTPAQRESIWFATLIKEGEPPASVLRSIAAHSTLSAAEKTGISLAVLGMARSRAEALAGQSTPRRIPGWKVDSAAPILVEADRFAHTTTTLVGHANQMASTESKRGAARAIQAYALELEIEQLDDVYADMPPGEALPAIPFAYTDAKTSLGRVSQESHLSRRPAMDLPWSTEQLWDCLQAAETVGATRSSPALGLSNALDLTQSAAAPAPRAPRATTPGQQRRGTLAASVPTTGAPDGTQVEHPPTGANAQPTINAPTAPTPGRTVPR